jgi:flagellar biosynthesis protein FlhG
LTDNHNKKDPMTLPPKSIAVVSGKGGSGKTMLVAVIAQTLDQLQIPTIIVDADTGTGGMTFYLGLKQVANTSVGLVDVAITLKDSQIPELPQGSLQPLENYKHIEFFGLGDHERLYDEVDEKLIPDLLHQTLTLLKEQKKWLVVDCRGGIDRESLAVCQEVDDIVIVAETDTTSFQATQHLVRVLSVNRLAHKLRGFIINKAIDDPSNVALRGRTAFKCKYLYSLPLDFKATRAFLVGQVPSVHSLLGTHTWQALHVLYPEMIPRPPDRPWTHKEFSEVGVTNLESLRGGLLVSGLLVMFGVLYVFYLPLLDVFISRTVAAMTFVLLGLFGSLEFTRRAIGRLLDIYILILKRAFHREEDSR